MSAINQNLLTGLTAHFARLFAEFLPAEAACDRWESTVQALRKHGLLETLVPAPYSKLGFSREYLRIERDRLNEREHLTQVSAWLATELVCLLKRELDDVAVHLLLTTPLPRIIDGLRALPLNRSTGKGITRFLLSETVEDVTACSAEITKIMSALDNRFATIGRVIERESSRANTRLQERIDRSYQDATGILADRFRLSQLEMECKRSK